LQTQTLPGLSLDREEEELLLLLLLPKWTLVDRFQTRISHHPRSVAHQLGQ
jgi:hypothetical protein